MESEVAVIMTDISIIVAFAKEEVSLKMKRMLESGGYRSGVCKSVSEIIRTAADMERVLVIMGQKLPDGNADDVYDALGGNPVIVAAKPEKRQMIESENIIFLTLPTSRADVLQAVEMVISPPRKKRTDKRPARSEEDRKIIEQAKLYLMETHMMSEEQAHRFIQKRSMDMGTRFVDTAKMILG